MTVTISRLFDDYDTAAQAVEELEGVGIPHSDISIVASNADNWYSGRKPTGGAAHAPGEHDRDHDGVDDRAESAGTGAGIGAVVGGTVGLLAGLGLLAIPGIGPVVAAGWLATTAAGALAGGAAGGAVGALTEAGVSREDAPVYAEAIRRGGSMVSVRVPEEQRARVEEVLNRLAVDTRVRGEAYRKSGWTTFDEAAPPYTSEQVSRERTLYR